jgi:hypothetical protein
MKALVLLLAVFMLGLIVGTRLHAPAQERLS